MAGTSVFSPEFEEEPAATKISKIVVFINATMLKTSVLQHLQAELPKKAYICGRYS